MYWWSRIICNNKYTYYRDAYYSLVWCFSLNMEWLVLLSLTLERLLLCCQFQACSLRQFAVTSLCWFSFTFIYCDRHLKTTNHIIVIKTRVAADLFYQAVQEYFVKTINIFPTDHMTCSGYCYAVCSDSARSRQGWGYADDVWWLSVCYFSTNFLEMVCSKVFAERTIPALPSYLLFYTVKNIPHLN